MKPRVLSFLALLASLPAPGHAQSPVVQECQRSPLDTLPPQPIQAAIDQLGGPPARVAAALRLCGDTAKWLALVDLPTRDIGQERGWRFALLVDSAGAPRIRYITQGLIDSYAPDFRLFRSGVEYLLLAEEGDEGGSWGIATYDVGPFLIYDLGLLDVGRPADDDTGNDQSVLDSARVTRTIAGWRVSFAVPIVLRPNQDDRKVLALPRNGQISLRPGGPWRLAQ